MFINLINEGVNEEKSITVVLCFLISKICDRAVHENNDLRNGQARGYAVPIDEQRYQGSFLCFCCWFPEILFLEIPMRKQK